MSLSLDGVRVLELARYQAGPRGGMILSDLGAEVIKIERPGGEETRRHAPMVRGQSIYFTVYNRGKKSICLDMRHPRGKEIFSDLVKGADIVLENFRPGTMKTMGFDYERLHALNPGIILVSVSGFGQYGPYTDRPAFDPLGQAMSGLMTLTGKPVGQPLGTASSVVDRYTALHATIGALAALRHRDRTGEGQLVDVCLLDSALTMVEIPTSYYLATGEEGGEGGRPPYRAKDGYVVISAAGTRDGGAAGATGFRWNFRRRRTDHRRPGQRRCRRALEAWCAERPVETICSALMEIGVPVAPVRTIPEVAKDPHLWEREMLVKMEDAVAGELYVPGVTVKMSKTPGHVGPVPTPGQHTDEVLGRLLGYDSDTLGGTAPVRRDRMSTVAIIGAGIGGVYLVAELGLAGHRLRLHDLDDTRLAEIRAHGGVDVEPGGLAAVESATTELPAAMDGADVIIVVTGGNAQPAVARSLAPLLRDGQIVLLIQGNTGGSLVVRRTLDEAGCRADVDVAEMDNYPFSNWRLGPTRIRPIVKKRWLQIASFPGCRIAAVFSRLAPLFPHAVAAPNVIHTGFTNANAMLHVANCIGNAGKIDRGESYKFYAEGVTPSVARLYQAINAERVAALPRWARPCRRWRTGSIASMACAERTCSETCRLLTTNSDGPYQATGTPKSFDHKYITEDVPVGLMPMSALGAAAGVPTPAIDALITLARAMAGDGFLS